MIFNQFGFLFLFLPAVMAAFFWLPRGWRPLVLIAGSFLFYGMSGIEHAVVLALDILWVFALTRRPEIVGSRALAWAAVVPPLIGLFYYKYMGFFIGQVLGLDLRGNEEFSLFDDVILPAGISFFTFQLVSFVIDRFRGEVPDMPSLRQFTLYVSFFPQLVAGPILRFHDVRQPLRDLLAWTLDRDSAARAIGYVSLGLGAKVLLADTLSNNIAAFTAAPGTLSPVTALYVILAYSFQIYFDFYGYSLIAIGLGTLFGFHFPDNFKRPYDALNPREFWRRWHITLSFWIRDYLYLPLGGNDAYLRNIVIVFAVCGLWHGAGWTFVIWGLYHGALVVAYHVGRRWWDGLPSLLARGLTFSLVSLGWVLFLFDFEEIRQFTTSLIGLAGVGAADPDFNMWFAVIVAAAVCFGVHLEPIAENRPTGRWHMLLRNAGLAGVLYAVLLFLDRTQTFIYFRF